MHRFRSAARLLIAILLAWPPTPAAACISDGTPPDWRIGQAEVIAVGEVIEAGPDTLTLRVDEYWKGWGGGEELSVDNHGYSSCSNDHHPGPLVTKGTRIVALLWDAEDHSDADWGFYQGSLIIVEAPPGRAGWTHYGAAETTPAGVVKRDVEALLESAWSGVALGLLVMYGLMYGLRQARLNAAGPSLD